MPGIRRILVHDNRGTIISKSNPIVVKEKEPDDFKIYWGDVHWHSNLGRNPINIPYPHGDQSPQFGYEFARNISKLDFTGLSEHAFRLSNPHADWQTMIDLANEYHHPGRFVTILGYEWDGGPADGHHSILFPGTADEKYRAGVNVPKIAYPGCPYISGVLKENLPRDLFTHSDDLHKLWSLLANYRAIMIPHHMDKQVFSSDYRLPAMTPFVEIYSKHGASEYSENSRTTIAQKLASNPGKNLAQNALLDGWRIGFIGGSDSHATVPGATVNESRRKRLQYPQPGLTAVLAPELTREAIWNALINRRTYATSSPRIYLSFKANDHFMGETVALANGQKPAFQVQVAGTGDIDKIVIVKGIPATKKISQFQLYTADSDNPLKNIQAEFTDDEFKDESFYYLRVTQVDQERAWSSPIWIQNDATQGKE